MPFRSNLPAILRLRLGANDKFEPGDALSNLNLTFPQIFAAPNLNASFRCVKFKLFYDAIYPLKKLVQIVVAAVTLPPRHCKINRFARILQPQRQDKRYG